ncbi:hypothetical protein CBL_11658 [Carabus blaptoides fortunei]
MVVITTVLLYLPEIKMPIIIKDYTWQQTQKHITIKIPAKRAIKKDVDFLTTRRYIKVHYNQFFFELFLTRDIDNTESNCFITDDEIIIELSKVTPEQWDVLEANINKPDKLKLKKKYLEEFEEQVQQQAKLKCDKKAELKRVAVRQQIAIDAKFRETIDDIRKEEKEKALSELQLWENKETDTRCKIKEVPIKCQSSTTRVASTRNIVKNKNVNASPSLPLPRKCQTVNISFTAREFPTPSRESKAQEEQEWLTKQAEARRSAGFDDGDLRPEERNPQWLKEKGDEFFKAKNYLGAISAYTTGIKISNNLTSLYVNRSAAHFACGNLHKSIEDCSTALELMTPICQANLNARARCLARRGAALCKLGLIREGASEMEAALKLIPNDESLKQDLQTVQAELNN